MWFSALKLGLNAATHIYKKKQETKMKMADAQLMHADKMARGEEAYQGKLLEARQSDWKDEAVLIILTLPIAVIAGGDICRAPAITNIGSVNTINTNSSFQSDCRASSNLPWYSLSPRAILSACISCASAIFIFVSCFFL